MAEEFERPLLKTTGLIPEFPEERRNSDDYQEDGTAYGWSEMEPAMGCEPLYMQTNTSR
ncbi:MAG: hypothetical protein V1887_03890 [Candidatus Aenigmatarchaeota archaeon]